MEITDSLLLIDGVKVASWSDKYTDVCMVSVMLNDKEDFPKLSQKCW